MILHVGPEKTGSTSFQNFLDRHRDALLERGILFPASVFTRKVKQQPTRTSGHLQLIRDISAGDISSFEAERRDNPHDTLVLSAENIFHHADDTPLEQLKFVLEDAPITLVAVLRRQDAWLTSYYAESVQGGWNREARSFDCFAQDIASSGMLDYEACLDRLIRIFNPVQVNILDYDSAQQEDGLLRNLVNTTDLPFTDEDMQGQPHSHVSRYDAEGLEAHRRLNTLARTFWSKDMHVWTQEMLEISRGPRDRRTESRSSPLPRAETRRNITQTVSQGNMRLADRYLDGSPFGVPLSWPDLPPHVMDEEAVADVLKTGLESFLRIRDSVRSFQKKTSDIPPLLLLGTTEVQWLMKTLEKTRSVLGFQADALCYLTALLPGCSAIFAETCRDRAMAIQMDLDRLDLPSTPIVLHCPTSASLWDFPEVGTPDLVLLPRHMALDGLKQCRRHVRANMRVVVFPDQAHSNPAPDSLPKPNDRIGVLDVFDLTYRSGEAYHKEIARDSALRT